MKRKDKKEDKLLPEEGSRDVQQEETGQRKPSAIIMTYSAGYVLSGQDGKQTAGGEAQAQLDEENLSILPKFGEALRIPLRDISLITLSNYTIELTLTSKEKLTLSKLGQGLEDFFRSTSQLRNEVMLKDMLMTETVVKAGAQADFVYLDAAGQEKQKGTCEPRLCETALVVITDWGDLHRIPYCDIARVREEPYQVAVDTEYGESIVLSKMGKELDPWKRDLSAAMNALTVKVQGTLKELLPTADPSVIRRIARFMKEGKAARRLDIDSISPDLWGKMEKKLAAAGLKGEYAFLKSVAQEKRMCVGFKRGLISDLTGQYVWFLAPIYSADPKQPGNAIAMEAASAKEGAEGEGGAESGESAAGSGRATYFFRIASRADYPRFRSLEDLEAEVDRAIARMNRCMLAINFRREPIYLTDEQLEEPAYARYVYAVQKIPELRELRRLFIGRVIHSSPEQWQKDIRSLLGFNVSAADDQRWQARATLP
jgi:hypothetical protein